MIFYPDYVDDGNMYGWAYEFEDYDRDYIREYIEENMPWFGCETPDTFIYIPFYNPYTSEDVEIEVRLGDWFSSDELNQVS
jgi:hypothetical protein